MTKKFSLRRLLIRRISVPILLISLLVFIIGYFSVWHEVMKVYDAQLVHTSKVFLQLMQHEILEDEGIHLGIENPTLQHKYERKIGFRVWADNRLLTQSQNTIQFGDFNAPPGFSDQTINDYKWRFFVFLDPANGIKVEVSERYDLRYELIIQLLSAFALLVLVFIPLILLIVWVGVRKALTPVIEISRDVDRRSTDDLTSIGMPRLPVEIAPLIEAFNRLLARIAESFRREREFTDHAAHELRTPLAAMKTQTQVLMKKARGMKECETGLENLQSSINRSSHLVEQLLSLARMQNESFRKARFNLSDCIHDCVDEYRVASGHKTPEIRSNIQDDVYIVGHEPSIEILVRNLLDNAVKYTTAGHITVELTRDATLKISDTGPGLTNEDKKNVFDRFYRADKSGKTGSGLGLSISQCIASAHGVEIELYDNQPRGLIVVINWTTDS